MNTEPKIWNSSDIQWYTKVLGNSHNCSVLSFSDVWAEEYEWCLNDSKHLREEILNNEWLKIPNSDSAFNSETWDIVSCEQDTQTADWSCEFVDNTAQ